MSQTIELQNFKDTLPSPYLVTRTRLGSNTKLIDEKFTCGIRELSNLYESIGEKIVSFYPKKIGFQYLISFTDNTHYEDNQLDAIEKNINFK